MIEWQGCYDSSWQGEIVPESFGHPAKIARGLVRQIYAHAFYERWLLASDTILDPFGGIGGTALDALWRGCRWIGIELEPKFCALAEKNIELWNRKYSTRAGWGKGRIVQGDSRRLADLIAGADFIVGSPPFLDQVAQQDRKFKMPHDSTGNINVDYGATEGQLGAMPEGKFDAIVSSPPFNENRANQIHGQTKGFHSYDKNESVSRMKRDYVLAENPANLGNALTDTFWSSAREIVAQCYQVLRPGGHAIWVCKDFVRKGKRVPFSDQWQALCEQEGFRLACRHRASLVLAWEEETLFGVTFEKKERKSFFRRLAERKGSPPIDWEDVICLQKIDGGQDGRER